MRVWQGLSLSVLGHVSLVFVLFNMPLAVHRIPGCIEIRLVSPAEFQGDTGPHDDDAGGPPGSPAGDPQERSGVPAENQAREAPRTPEKIPVVQDPVRPKRDFPEKRAGLAAARGEISPKAKRKPRATPPGPSPPEAGQSPGQSPAPESPGMQSCGSSASSVLSASGENAGGGAGIAAGKGRGVPDSTFGSENGPRFAKQVRPRYPRVARRLGKEGTVLLRLTIDAHGRLIDVEVLAGAGSGFDEEAVQAVKESTFIPARVNGRPMTSRAVLPVRFVLRNSG